MRGLEIGGQTDSPRELLFARIQYLPQGVYRLSDHTFMAVLPGTPETVGVEKTVEVYDPQDNIFGTRESGWYKYRMRVNYRKMSGIKRRIRTTSEALWNRGEGKKVIALRGIPVDLSTVNMGRYASHLAGITSATRRVPASVENPLGAVPIGEYVSDSIYTLLGNAGKLKDEESRLLTTDLPYSLAAGQQIPEGMTPDDLWGRYSDVGEAAEFPLADGHETMRVGRYRNNETVLSGINFSDEGGRFQTFIVQLSNMSLQELTIRKRKALFAPVSAIECMRMVNILDSLRG